MSSAPSLIGRMDTFLSGLIDEAERDKEKAGNDSGLGVPLTERVALLKAATDYLKVRDNLKDAGRTEAKPPEIDGLINRIRKSDNRTLGRSNGA